ncbi:MAG: hypothetical protein Q7U04_02845 [Bacteriovorax sp.]|nr:hypothetical protein [Bacteriovorax sp.]
MKHAILIVSSLFCSSLIAADWNLKNENEIYDLMPLTTKGKFSSETLYNSTNADDKVLTLNAVNYFTYKHSNSNLNENFNFGVLDSLEVGLSVGYQFSDEVKLTYGPASGSNGLVETYKESGLTSPAINARYRLFSQSTSFANSDFIFSFSPKIGTSKDATANKKGNALCESSLLVVGLEFGKKYTDMAWRMGAKGSFYGTGKSEDADDSTSTTAKDSYIDMLIDGSWQWTFSSKYILNATLGFGSVGDIVSTTSSHTKTNEQKRDYTLFGVDFKYLLSKETYLGLGISSKSFDKSNLVVSDTQTHVIVNIPEAATSDTSLSLSIKTEF